MFKGGLAAVAVVAALGCWLFAGALFSGKVLGGDDQILFSPPFQPAPGQTRPANPFTFDSAWVLHPDMLEAREQLRDFRLPVWNPRQGAGQPLLASQQSAPLYPLNWISDVLPFWQSLEWVALLKLLVAGGGMLLFGRALGLGRLPTLFAAISFAFSTYMIGWFAHPHSNAFVLLPWLMLAADRLARDARWRSALALALVVGITLLGGHPESGLLVLLATVLWFLFRSVGSSQDARARNDLVRRVLLLGAGLVLGVAIAAVMLVPFAEMLGQAQDASRSGGPGPRSLLQSFVLPERWGRPDKFTLPGGPFNYQERTAYFGALPLLFGIAGLLIRPTRVQVFFAVLAILALGLAVDIPVYSKLAAAMPGLDHVYRIRALAVCTFAGAVLAGFGLQALLDGGVPRRRLAASLGLVLLPLFAWLALAVDWSAPVGDALGQLPVLGHDPKPRGVVELAAALRVVILLAVGITIVAVARLRPRLATAAAVAALAVTAADLVTLDRGYIPAIPEAQANPAPPAAIRYAQANAGHERVGGGIGLQPNLAERFDLRGARIHALPALKRRNMVWFALGGIGLPQRLQSSPRRLASLFATKFVFVAPGQRLDDPSTRKVAPLLYRNRAALPRAWIAYDWSPAGGADDALRRLSQRPPGQDLHKPVIEGVPSRINADAPSRAGSVHFDRDEDVEVDLRVDAAKPGYVILDDLYYPGWHATVDGRDAQIHPANVAFRAVAVPAGTHSVRFEYGPASVRAGMIVSALALLATALGFVLTRRRTSPARTPRRARRRPA